MYKIDTDTYVCDCCGREYKWDGEEYGNIWECEECGKHFCTDCFTAALGRDAFDSMTRMFEKVLCPDCYVNNAEVEIENLWQAFSDIGIDDQDRITEPFMDWEAGTDRFEIWHWFDEQYPGGVHKLIGVEAGL